MQSPCVTVAVRLQDLGLAGIDERFGDLVQRSTAFADDLGNAMLQSHLDAFGQFVVELGWDYKAVTMQYHHRHYGLDCDGNSLRFTLHLSAVHDAINVELSKEAAEGERLWFYGR